MSNMRSAKSTIARRLILYIILFSSFITLVTTAIQLYRDYNTDLNLIYSELEQIEGVHLDSLAAALWASNRELLQTSIDGILEIRDMQYVEVRDDEQVWASSGKNIEENTIRHRYPMTHRHRNKDINIGNLTVVVSLNGVYQRLIDKVWVILISNAIKTFLVATFIYFLFYRLVAKHLSRISQFAETDDPLSKDGTLTLDRTTKRYDEFDILVDSINDMHNRLHEQITEANHQKQHLAQTLNSIGDAVITTDAEGRITRMNPVAEQLTGWSLQDAQGKPVKIVFPIVHATTHEAIENPIDKVLATGETVYLSNHTTLIAKDGAKYQIADSAAPIRANHDSDIQGMVLVFNDVTEKYHLRETAAKNSQRLAYAQRMAHIGNWDLNLVTGKLEWSDEIYRIFEVNPEKFAASYDAFLDAIHPDDREKVRNAYTESVKNKTPYNIEHRLRMPDGRIKHVLERCKTFYDDKGNPIHSAGTVQDITEKTHLEETLRRTQKMDALGKLTGGIAHDYNNMLGIILGYTELLENELNDQPRPATYARRIQHAAKRGTKLTQKLLAFSRHKGSDAEVVNINTLLREEQHMLEKTLTARIQLTLNLADNLWPVWLDNNDLEDTIVNMCINAMHAMKTGGELTFRTSNEKLDKNDARVLSLAAGDYVLLSITDTGIGMDETIKDKIFDPFYTTKGEGGTGLGLSQVYGFVARSNGAIKVYSEPGHGSRFALYFPRSRQTHTEIQTSTTDNVHCLGGSETLLVVDDELALLELAQNILTTQGYRVLTADDGEQALTVLETESVDLVISDVIMPNMDGYQLAAKVRQRYPHIKLQMVSGFSDDRHDGMTDDALHQNMLYKPYTSHTLLTHVRSRLNETKSESCKPASPDKGNPTILVMDDEENARELFTLNLKMLGYDTLLACNGDEAIAHYQQALENGKTINAAILDLSIPGGMEGKEVAKKIRTLAPHARLIVASGHSEGPEMTRYEDYGFNGALEKNFNREKLKQVLEQVLATT
ncbi:MAG TPA: response regulator [Gammaproteobacteria bacterium]|nr:response regulator [Gammaproteobacteria bacterium]